MWWEKAVVELKKRETCCDTVVHMFNMVAVLHRLWDTWGPRCHSVPSSWRQCCWLWSSRVDPQADFTKLRMRRPACQLQHRRSRFGCVGRGQYAIVWAQKVASVRNHVRSNHVSLSKGTASAEKISQFFQQAGNVCTHSWLTTRPLFSRKGLRQASVTAKYQGKPGPNPPGPPPPAASRSSRRWARLRSANCAIK